MYLDQLQPVILAGGRGSRMNQLTGSSIIKCLVPVYGHPLIFYTLKLLALNGFKGKGRVGLLLQLIS
jgi:NDP-sugar pyrophosphorylase family protein